MQKTVKAILTIGLAISVLGASGTYLAFAAPSGAFTRLAASDDMPALPEIPGDTQTPPGLPPELGEFGGRRTFQAASFDFSALVSQGVIDQAAADKITAYLEEKSSGMKAEAEKLRGMTEEERKAYFESRTGEPRAEKTDMFAEMVAGGVITQAQADAVKAAVPQPVFHSGGMAARFDLDGLVSQGVIDQAAADKITAYLEEKSSGMKAEAEKLRGMTEEERKAYFESRTGEPRAEKTDMFAEMVAGGVITQAQADAVKAAMPQPPDADQIKSGKGKTGRPEISADTSADVSAAGAVKLKWAQ